MFVFGIDPGPESSGFAVLQYEPVLCVVQSGELENLELLHKLRDFCDGALAVEGLGYQGEHIGRSVLMTAEWIGRFLQHFLDNGGICCDRLERAEVSRHFTGLRASTKAAVHDRVRCRFYPTGELKKVKGTKGAPGPCYGVSGDHSWDACGVALAYAERAGLLAAPRLPPVAVGPATSAAS